MTGTLSLLYTTKYFDIRTAALLAAEVVMNVSLTKQPIAWLPMVMSVAALATVLGHAAKYGIVHEADEGTAAHIFQLLMVGQLPLIGWFALTWLPREPRRALRVLALQAAAAVAAFAAVYFLT